MIIYFMSIDTKQLIFKYYPDTWWETKLYPHITQQAMDEPDGPDWVHNSPPIKGPLNVYGDCEIYMLMHKLLIECNSDMGKCLHFFAVKNSKSGWPENDPITDQISILFNQNYGTDHKEKMENVLKNVLLFYSDIEGDIYLPSGLLKPNARLLMNYIQVLYNIMKGGIPDGMLYSLKFSEVGSGTVFCEEDHEEDQEPSQNSGDDHNTDAHPLGLVSNEG